MQNLLNSLVSTSSRHEKYRYKQEKRGFQQQAHPLSRLKVR